MQDDLNSNKNQMSFKYKFNKMRLDRPIFYLLLSNKYK